MKKYIQFGLITGLVIGAWNLSCFSIVGWLNNSFTLGIPSARIRAYSGLFGIIILITCIYAGIKAVKRQNDGTLTYKQAAATGIGISLITAVMSAIFAYVYCTIINPGYTDYMVRDAQKALQAAGKTPEQINQQLIAVRAGFSPISQVIQALIGQSVVGTIGSLIIGLFAKTQKQ